MWVIIKTNTINNDEPNARTHNNSVFFDLRLFPWSWYVEVHAPLLETQSCVRRLP